MFAAAAETLGGVYGTVALERALRFTPAARAKRQAELRAAEVAAAPPQGKAKTALPTGTCKKWLKGHVPLEQTLAMIAEPHPKVAARMQEARECDLVRAHTITRDDFSFLGKRMAALSPELFGMYILCMALGRHNAGFASDLAAELLHLATTNKDSKALVLVIATDRQLPSPLTPEVATSLDQAFRLALKQSAATDPEVAFAQKAISEVWSRRAIKRKLLEARPAISQMFAAKVSNFREIETNQGGFDPPSTQKPEPDLRKYMI